MLSALALFITAIALFFFRRRRNASLHGHVRLLDPPHPPRDSYASSQFNGAVLAMRDAPGKRRGVGLFSGLGVLESKASKARRARRDILADEDTGYFSGTPYYMLDGAGSTWSLRSVGAMIGGAMGRRTREASSLSTHSGPLREKSDPFSDGLALMRDQDNNSVGASSRPHGRRHQSYSSALSRSSYVDPFADAIVEEAREDPSSPSNYDNVTTGSTNVHPYPPHLPPYQTIAPQSADVQIFPYPQHQPGTVTPKRSHTSFPTHSLATTNGSLGVSSSYPYPAPSLPIRRSNSWWARFARTSFLDRRPSNSGRRFVDIRDPNPPPRLAAITEAPTLQEESLASSTVGHSQSRSRMGHSKSVASCRSTRTTDTAAIERMGGMDVVQRVMTPSRQSMGSIGGRGSPIDTIDMAPWLDRPHGSLSDGDDDPLVGPPTDSDSDALSPLEEPTSPWRSGGAVAAQVRAYERRMSVEQDLANLPPVNSRKLEEKTRKRGQSVNYGLAPRPSLYVANPDTAHSNSASSTWV